jgi:DNA-binding transcriptional LysR family regulator
MNFSDRLTLRGLRIFIALEEAQSVAKAAQKLGMSKSSISQHITTLEQSTGITLFDRKQKPVALTPAGQILSAHAHRIVAMVAEAEAALADNDANSLPVLNFAIIDDLDASLTPVMATALQAKLPRSYICTFSGRSDQVTARMMSRQADIAITASIPADIEKFQIQELFREHFVLVVAKGFYQETEDWRSQLATLPLVQYSETMPIGHLVVTHLKRIRLEVTRRYSFETTRSVIATVAKTGGWTLSTPLSILDASRFRDEVEFFPLPFAGLSRSVFLINRLHELGTLPDILTNTFQQLLRSELVPEFKKVAPNVADMLEAFEDVVD